MKLKICESVSRVHNTYEVVLFFKSYLTDFAEQKLYFKDTNTSKLITFLKAYFEQIEKWPNESNQTLHHEGPLWKYELESIDFYSGDIEGLTHNFRWPNFGDVYYLHDIAIFYYNENGIKYRVEIDKNE